MKKILPLSVILVLGLLFTSCSGAFWTGAGGGTLAAGTGYELRARQEMERIKKDLDAQRMSQEEYAIRRDEIQRMSLTQ